MTTATSLWPDDLVAESMPSTPAGLLREQADGLEEKTKGELKAEVHEVHRDGLGESEFSYSFDLFAPRIAYRYSLFDIEHGPAQYPTRIYVDNRIGSELGWATGPNPSGRPRKEANSDDELRDALREVFGSSFTRNVVRGLLAQSADSRRVEPYPDDVPW